MLLKKKQLEYHDLEQKRRQEKDGLVKKTYQKNILKSGILRHDIAPTEADKLLMEALDVMKIEYEFGKRFRGKKLSFQVNFIVPSQEEKSIALIIEPSKMTEPQKQQVAIERNYLRVVEKCQVIIVNEKDVMEDTVNAISKLLQYKPNRFNTELV